MTSTQLFLDIPRISLAPLMTPIYRCRQLEPLIENMPELYVKHDEYIGPLVWGNKLRKLEYVFAEAQKNGVDTLITCGGIQSNHARTTAQAAKRFGFRVILVLNGAKPLKPTGNLLINYKIGAEVHFVETREGRNPKMNLLAAEAEANGHKVMIIPLGASNETGALGFVRAIEELRFQERELDFNFDYIFHASSSGGTQSGMLVGKALFCLKAKIMGISADDPAEDIRKTILGIALPVMNRLQMDQVLKADDVSVDDRFIGQGYGIPSAESLEAERLFGQNEGILLDHYYTAKAAAAIISYSRAKYFKPTDKVLLWHTGGTVSIFQ